MIVYKGTRFVVVESYRTPGAVFQVKIGDEAYLTVKEREGKPITDSVDLHIYGQEEEAKGKK